MSVCRNTILLLHKWPYLEEEVETEQNVSGKEGEPVRVEGEDQLHTEKAAIQIG